MAFVIVAEDGDGGTYGPFVSRESAHHWAEQRNEHHAKKSDYWSFFQCYQMHAPHYDQEGKGDN